MTINRLSYQHKVCLRRKQKVTSKVQQNI